MGEPGRPGEGKSLGSLAHSASRQILGGAGAFLANKSRLVRSCDREKTWLFSRLQAKYPQAHRSKRRCCGQKTWKCCGLRDEPTFPARMPDLQWSPPGGWRRRKLLLNDPGRAGHQQCLNGCNYQLKLLVLVIFRGFYKN